MKKRLLAVLLALVLAFTVAACGSKNDGDDMGNAENTEEATEETTEVTDETPAYEKVDIHEASKVDQMAKPEKGETIAIIDVEGYGKLKLKFFHQEAPLAVENFLTLAANGYYDGICFHRVINHFMIQGGDPTATGAGGQSMWGEPFDNEYTDILLPLRGTMAMANSGPDTNGSQFFIIQNEDVTPDIYGDKEFTDEQKKMFEEYGGYPFLGDDYTIFGQLYDGWDVLDAIAQTETDVNDRPLEDVIIKKITVKTAK